MLTQKVRDQVRDLSVMNTIQFSLFSISTFIDPTILLYPCTLHCFHLHSITHVAEMKQTVNG